MQSKRANLIISLLGGFLSSFLAFSIASYSTDAALRGQLMAGDPTVNSNFPSTLNAFRRAVDGSDPMIASLHSFGWWTLVIIGGFVAAVIIFKLMRRYV